MSYKYTTSSSFPMASLLSSLHAEAAKLKPMPIVPKLAMHPADFHNLEMRTAAALGCASTEQLKGKIDDELNLLKGIEVIQSEVIPEGKVILYNAKYRFVDPAKGMAVIDFQLKSPTEEKEDRVKQQMKDLGLDE